MELEIVKNILLEHEGTVKPGKNFHKVYQKLHNLNGQLTQEELTQLISKAYKDMLRIDIGCGGRKKTGYFGIDYLDIPEVDCVVDLRNGKLPLSDNTVDTVYSDHFLEHLAIENVLSIMREIHRVCKPNAIVEIHVPHFSGYTNFYEFHKTAFRYFSFGEFTSGPHGMFKFHEQFDIFFRKLNLVNRQSPLAHPFTKWFLWNYPMEWLVNKFPWVYEMTGWRNIFPAWEIILKMRVIK